MAAWEGASAAAKPGHGLVREHDAPAEGVVRPVALVDLDAGARQRLLQQDRRVQPRRPAAHADDALHARNFRYCVNLDVNQMPARLEWRAVGRASARLRPRVHFRPMSYLFPPTIPAVRIKGRPEQFAVHRIYCVGRNYAAHAREMGANPDREPPFFFTKPADAHRAEPRAHPLSVAHQQLPPRDRAGGRDRQGRTRHPGRAGARPRLTAMRSATTSPGATCNRTRRTTAGRGIPARASITPRSSARSRRPRSRDICAAAGSG